MNWIKRIFGIKENPWKPKVFSKSSPSVPSYINGINSFPNNELPRTNGAADDLIMASLMSMHVTDHDNVSQSVSNDTGFDNGFGGGGFGGSGASGSWDSGPSSDSGSYDSSSYSND